MSGLEPSGQFNLVCPNCGHKEQTGFMPTFDISFDGSVTIKHINCTKCGYDGQPWPFDDECPECGGEVTAEIVARAAGQPLEANLRCAGDGHEDDGSDCGHQWQWTNPEKGEILEGEDG